jgi:hypothetical protein
MLATTARSPLLPQGQLLVVERYVPWGQYYATGTVTLNSPNEESKTIALRVDRMKGAGSTGTGTKPGYRRLIRGQWQMTKYFVYPLH